MGILAYIIGSIVVLATCAWIGKKNEALNQLLTPIAILAFIILLLMVAQAFYSSMCLLGGC